MLDLQAGAYFSLNPVGTALLKGLVEGNSIESVVHSVASDFGTSPEDVFKDVQPFLQELKQAQLLDLDPLGPSQDEDLGRLTYVPPKMHRYDQLSQVVSYSPDEL